MSNLLFYHTLFCLYWNWRWIFSCFYSSVRCRILCLIKKRNYSNLTILAESFFIIRYFNVKVREVYNDATPVLLIRFLGTSPDSSTIQPLLHSLCVQISYLYDQPIEDIPSDLVLLQVHMQMLQ